MSWSSWALAFAISLGGGVLTGVAILLLFGYCGVRREKAMDEIDL